MDCKNLDILSVPNLQKRNIGCGAIADPPPDPPVPPSTEEDIPVVPPTLDPANCELTARGFYTPTAIRTVLGGGSLWSSGDGWASLNSPSCYDLLSSPTSIRAIYPQLGNAEGVYKLVGAGFEQRDWWCAVPLNKNITRFYINGHAWRKQGNQLTNFVGVAESFSVSIDFFAMPDGSCHYAPSSLEYLRLGNPLIPNIQPNPGYSVSAFPDYPTYAGGYGFVACSETRWSPNAGGGLGFGAFSTVTRYGVIKNPRVIVHSDRPFRFTIESDLEALNAINWFPTTTGKIPTDSQGWFSIAAHKFFEGSCPSTASFGGGFSATAEIIIN